MATRKGPRKPLTIGYQVPVANLTRDLYVRLPQVDQIDARPEVRDRLQKLQYLDSLLPSGGAVADDEHDRQYQVWYKALKAYERAFCLAFLKALFGDDMADPQTLTGEEQLALAGMPEPEALAKLEHHLKIFRGFINKEVRPRLGRLVKGLDYLDQLDRALELKDGVVGHDPETLANHQQYSGALDLWVQIRTEIKDAEPQAWVFGAEAVAMYLSLDQAGRQAAIKRFGPLASQDGLFGPMWHQTWPTRELKEVDKRAREDHFIYQPSDVQNLDPDRAEEAKAKARATRRAKAARIVDDL